MSQVGNITRRAVALGTAASGALAASSAFGRPARAPRRPNIILFLADDLRFDGVGYRNPMVRTPNLDKLAARGTRFPNAFVTTSICPTSRACIQSGTYARRNGVWDFSTPLPEGLRERTYPRLLRAAGYRTGYFGKYGIGDTSKGAAAALPLDFDAFQTFEDYYPKDDTARRWHNNRRLSELARTFIKETPARTPFCLTVGFKAPHAKDDGDPVMGPYVAEPEMLALYANDIFTRAAAMNEAAFEQLPGFLKTSEARKRWRDRFSSPELWQDSVHKYFALVTGMDRAIGEILAALEASGAAEDTMIVFSSDNGYFLGDYGLEGKWFGYEASIRVPLLIVSPGGANPREVSATALNVDLAPTLLSAAGAQVPATMQGRNLLPLVRGETPRNWRDDFLYEHYVSRLYGFSPEPEQMVPSSEGVRGARYTYLRYPRQPGLNEMVFDRQADPAELRNIATTCSPDLLRSLRRRTDELIVEAS